ncbi:MAG: CDGSH iron-sulfur domain-containing protein [Candidatus Hydrogenedentes bacterium]|jgi:CDGSH-type Zn-finger protein|nr:CDGSH iron-sulfur domain-containing protein [Candidatus Hydrogenedentota bacterium]
MPDPVIASKQPCVLDLEPDTYFWCACGRSTMQPWCDGSHKGTTFTPVEYIVKEKKRVAVCTCKYTADPPYCDGAHKDLP